jgi:putative endonuclease
MNPRTASASTSAVGALWETIALQHLQRAGLVLVMRNFCCRHGELDLVMQHDATLVFVEVRYRRGVSSAHAGFGDGIDSISAAKRAKLVRAASAFLSMHPHLAHRTCRFDVVALAGDPSAPLLDWRQNAFEAG